MSVVTDSLNGAFTLRDSDKSWRLFDAAGDLVRKWSLRPGLPCDASSGDPSEFVVTVTEAGAGDSTMAPGQADGYSLLITTDNVEYDGVNAQLRGETCSLASGRTAYLRGIVKLSEATLTDFLFGLCELKTDLLKTSTAHGITATGVEGVFFHKPAASTAIAFKVYVDGAETFTAAVGTEAADDIEYEIVWDGTSVKAYVDGVLITTFAGSLPDGMLTPSINFRAGSAAARTASFAELSYIAIG